MKKSFVMVMAVLALTMASCGNKTQEAGAADSTQVENVADSAAAKLSAEGQKTVDALTTELEKDIQAKDAKKVIVSLANMQTIYKNLVENGKLEEATSYGWAIQQFINKHADNLKNVATGNTTIASLVQGIQNLPTSAQTTAEEAKAAVSQDAVTLSTPAIQEGQTLIETADAAAQAVQNAPATVKAAAQNVAANAVNAAENTAKTAANNAVNAATNKAVETHNKVVNKVNEAQTQAANKVNQAQNKAAQRITEGQNKANNAINDAANKALQGIGLGNK